MQKQQWCLIGAALFVLAVATAIYIPGLHGPYVFDDLTNILQVPGIRITDLGLDSLKQALHARDYDELIGRPVAMLSFALNYYFTQFDVFYFKITNLFIHLVTGISLYWLTLTLLRRYKVLNTDCRYQPRHLPWLALTICALWLLHPLNLTTVLYVVQRMASLATLFIVLGLVGYCRGREQIIQGRKTGLLIILLSLLLFGTLAGLSKENGALILPLAAVIEAVFYRFAAHPSLTKLFRWFWAAVVVFPLVIATIALLANYDRWFGDYAYHQRDFTLMERVLTQTRALWFYLRLIFIPDIAQMGLYHDDFSTSKGLIEPFSTLLSVLGIIGLVIVAIVSRRRVPIIFFAISWLFVGHSMESTVFPLEMVHEHRNYLPQYGALFALVYFIAAPYHAKAIKRTLQIRLGFLGLFATLLAIGTYSRSLQWQDEYSLYTREVINHPASARAHTMLGAWMHVGGLREQARQELTIAVNLTPHQAEHLIRLVQNLYVSNHQVPDEILEELHYRLMQSRVSGVTLWVYEPLLRITREDKQLHNRLIEYFANVVSRPDIDFGRQWYETAYRLLAENHAFQGRGRVALRYYEQARAITPRPAYEIASAEIYAQNGCHAKADRLLSPLSTNDDLNPADRTRLQEVETLLSDRRNAATSCKLQ